MKAWSSLLGPYKIYLPYRTYRNATRPNCPVQSKKNRAKKLKEQKLCRIAANEAVAVQKLVPHSFDVVAEPYVPEVEEVAQGQVVPLMKPFLDNHDDLIRRQRAFVPRP